MFNDNFSTAKIYKNVAQKSSEYRSSTYKVFIQKYNFLITSVFV